MMRSPTTAEGNATIILRLGAMSSCRTTSISLSKGIQNFDLGVWIRGLKRVVAVAVAGGRVSHSVKTRALSFQSRSDERSLVH